MAYTTTALVKASLGIPTGTTSEDTYIAAAIGAAEDEINKFCGRTFEPDAAATTRVYQPSTNVLAYTDDFHTTTDLVVKQDDSNNGTYATTLTITTDFIVIGNEAPFNTIRSVSSPFPRYTSDRPTVEVTAKWGYKSAAPAAVLTSVLMPDSPDNFVLRAADWMEQRMHRAGLLDSWNQYVLINLVKRP